MGGETAHGHVHGVERFGYDCKKSRWGEGMDLNLISVAASIFSRFLHLALLFWNQTCEEGGRR